MVWKWLFGDNEKKRRADQERMRKKNASKPKAKLKKPELSQPAPPARPPKRDPAQTSEALGGSENIAAMIKALIQEDREK